MTRESFFSHRRNLVTSLRRITQERDFRIGINRIVVLPRSLFYVIAIETTLCTRYGNVIEIRSIDKEYNDRQITDNVGNVTLSRTLLWTYSAIIIKLRKHKYILGKKNIKENILSSERIITS